MVNTVSHAIDLAIDKKISQGIVNKNKVRDFVRYSKYNSVKSYNLNYLTHSFEAFDVKDKENIIEAQKDIYNNKFYNYLKVKKTQCRFNLIRLFEPGELLNSVMSS